MSVDMDSGPTIDVVAYLASKGIQTYKANGPEVTAHCWRCPDGDLKGKGKMYVNVVEGFFDCKRCSHSGGTYLLQKDFGDEPVKIAAGVDPNVRRKVLDWAVDVGSAMLIHNDDMLMYLMNDRGLTAETIVERKLGFVGNGWSLTGSLPEGFTRDELASTALVYRDGPRAGKDFFYNHLLIPYLSRGHCVQVRGKVVGGKYFTGPGDPVRLYNQDALDGAEDVVITEGEYDCMVLAQALQASPEDRVRKMAVIGLAGANGFTQGMDSYLSEAKRIFLALDPDDTGKREATKLKERLGNRARLVELPSQLPKCDWTEYLLPVPADASVAWHLRHPHAGHDWRDVVGLLGHASGKRVYSMQETGFAFRTQVEERVTVRTGFHQLDGTIQGMRPGQVMVVLAKTGCIQGDAEIAVNRAGKGFKIKLKDLVDRWDGKRYAWDLDIPTYVQREVDGQVRPGRLVNAWRSGVKTTYTVTTDTGRTIRATDQHPFLTERGWLRLDQLTVGDRVHVRGERSSAGRLPKVTKDHDPNNNDLSNLVVLTHSEHAALHADEGTTRNVQVNVALERVVSVEAYGEEETYDLEVEDDPHNFLANGFVVHNTGKTIFLCNLAYNMRAHKVLFLSLEMTKEECYERLRRIFLHHHPRASDYELEQGMAGIFICDENRLGDKDLATLVDEFEIESGVRPDVVFVDYLGYYARGQKGNSPYEKTTNAVMQLKAEAKAGRFVCIAPAQVNRGTKEGKPIDLDDARDSGAIEETADFLLSLWRPDDALQAEISNMQQSGKTKMTVLKSRHGGKDKTFTLVFDLLTLAMVDDGTQESKVAVQHNYLAWRGDTWEDLRADQTKPIQSEMPYRRDLQ